MSYTRFKKKTDNIFYFLSYCGFGKPYFPFCDHFLISCLKTGLKPVTIEIYFLSPSVLPLHSLTQKRAKPRNEAKDREEEREGIIISKCMLMTHTDTKSCLAQGDYIPIRHRPRRADFHARASGWFWRQNELLAALYMLPYTRLISVDVYVLQSLVQLRPVGGNYRPVLEFSAWGIYLKS